MRKLIDLGAGFFVAEFVISLFVPLTLLGTEPGVAVASVIVTAVLGVGYFLLMKRLGAWNEAAWYNMSDGRKTALFLLALPGMVGGILFIIILAIFGVFAGEAGKALQKSADRAEFRSDVQTAVRQELDRRGY